MFLNPVPLGIIWRCKPKLKRLLTRASFGNRIRGSFGTAISRWFTYQAKRSTCSRKCHLVWAVLPPPTLPKTNNSCIFYWRAGQRGIQHEHIISERAVPRAGLSSMMYVADRYLPHQSSDCFDIFINMSSIINHPGEVRPIPPLRAASDYR